MIDRAAAWFELEKHGSDTRTELMAGLTTFLTMAYIAFANPSILSAAGMPKDAVIAATCLSAGVASILMGVMGRLPIGLAPGMGTNAYFAFFVCGTLGHSWQTALGAVFVSGMVFLALTVTGIRERIIEGIPNPMKLGIAAGIGLFIAFVGLKSAQIVVKHDATFVTLGDLSSRGALVTFFGLALSGGLLARKVRGALLYGIVGATVLAIGLGVAKLPSAVVSLPTALGQTLLQLDVRAALSVGMLHLVFAFVFVDLFDTIATLIAVSEQGDLLVTREGGGRTLPRATHALSADAIGTMVGAALGTSTVTSYIESTSGIAAGGRTGLTAVTTGFLFLALVFFSPVIGVVPAQATAPALILVAVMMLKALRNLPFDDFTEAIPAVVAALAIPLTFSISNGLILGFVLYPLIKVLAGRAREVSPLVYGLAVLFVVRVLFLGE